MTREEYEARRRRLDEELRVAIELVEQGHRARVQSLDLAWHASASGAPTPPVEGPAPPAVPELPGKAKRRRRSGELYGEIIGLLPQLPETFSKEELAPLFTDPPDRASLFRVLQEMTWNGVLELARRGRGRDATTYRRAPRPQSS
ncbi:MAG TPA: hypothetical protein VE078_03755 [Thermoanaerobaculia bacterium]|nr:hypothetical protein [Thermoanaerobaculia bacterium]